MARPIEGASEDVARHGGIQGAALALIAAVLVLGTLLAWQIVRQRAVSRIDIARTGIEPGSLQQVDPAVAAALVSRGADLVQMQCSGCHASEVRLSGPSWQAIAQRARIELKQDPFCGTGLALMARAVTHPALGWNGYPAGPQPSTLSQQDRVALAAWILKQPATAPGGANGETP